MNSWKLGIIIFLWNYDLHSFLCLYLLTVRRTPPCTLIHINWQKLNEKSRIISNYCKIWTSVNWEINIEVIDGDTICIIATIHNRSLKNFFFNETNNHDCISQKYELLLSFIYIKSRILFFQLNINQLFICLFYFLLFLRHYMNIYFLWKVVSYEINKYY